MENIPTESIALSLSEIISPAFLGLIIIMFLLILLTIISYCIIFKKAGFKWYESLIPVHSFVVLLQIIKKPIWWIFLFIASYVVSFIISIINVGNEPFVLLSITSFLFMMFPLVLYIFIIHDLSKSFKHGVLFTIGIIFLPFVFLPIMAFSKDEYIELTN